jgi:lysyl-tRNA synthetase class 2
MPLHFYLIEAEMTQQNAQSTSEPTISENDLIAQRHAKLKQIQDVAKETGKSPWPNTFKREHAADLQEQFKDQSKEQIESAEHVYVKVWSCHVKPWFIHGDSRHDWSYPIIC